MDGDGWRQIHDRAWSVAMETSMKRKIQTPFTKCVLQFQNYAFLYMSNHVWYLNVSTQV